MNEIVSKTLKKWRQSKFIWGSSDCLLSLADYLVDCGHEDFGATFRGTYDDEPGAKRHIENWGGEINLIYSTCLNFTEQPEIGDIVLVKINEPIAGLCTGEKIAFRTERGVIEIGMKFLNIIHAWKVTQCHQ
jgi:hypothetical protein